MNKEIIIGSVSEGNEPFFIFNYLKEYNHSSILYISRNDREIFNIKKKLEWLCPGYEILIYRSWDQIPYDNVSPTKEIQSERIKTLYKLREKLKKRIVLTSVNAILQKTININNVDAYFIKIKKGNIINFNELIKKLIILGYQRSSIVREKTEFATRGSIIDIFISDHTNPLRIDFDGDTVDSIDQFNSLTQKKIKNFKNEILIHPSTEILLNDNSINLFRKNFRELFINYRHSEIYNSISNMIQPPGYEMYISIFYKKMCNLFFYLKDCNIIINNDFDKLIDSRLENIKDYYEVRKNLKDTFCLPFHHLYLKNIEISNLFRNFHIIKLREYNLQKNINFKIKKILSLSTIKKEIDFNYIKNFLKINENKKIIICSSSIGSLNRIKDIFLKNMNINLIKIYSINDLTYENNFFITNLFIEESYEFNNFIFLNEKTIFGYSFSNNKKKSHNKEIFFEEINKLTKNSILVHSEYGFCKFIDIQKIEINNSLHDCLKLEFFDNQILFLPIENLNLITKYGNDDTDNIQLDKLGTVHWQKRKAQAKNKIKDASKKLMSIAAKRMNSKSYNIDYNPVLFDQFASTFPFIETDDQLNAIEDIKVDFKKNIPSDRLIVGDVAFGKTEVMIRAVFLAANSNLQSLILVPTTILCRQHFNNFSKRFSSFGIKVGELSRLVSSKERNILLEKLNNGKIDVVIGTHALLSKKIKFKKLGLIIYDEEQKLGTLQKEKFKSIEPRAHVISLSATPIPRTLSLSLSGIRDLSLILTAPYERLAVRSFISPFDEITIIEAIKREIFGRKNSVFFVTPRIKDIPFLEKFIKENLPNIKYITAHGKLKPNILEERITKFYNKQIPLMISTNIIENGLDLPHVNTIIIYRSNLFSLASLYQLKGRVGRSSIRGYAYLTYNQKEITENSRKKLNIINSFEDIGSGFNIAAQDLDLRGSGSIIGEEQSGFITAIGTELYYQMLEEEISIEKNKFLKVNNKLNKLEFHPTIKIPEPIFIPDEYISDLDIKMSIYKRITHVANLEENENLISELFDRFGKLPNEVINLFKLIEIKIMCIEKKIDFIDFGRKGILFGFYKNKPLNPDKIFMLSKLKNSNYTIRRDEKLFYSFFGILNDDRFKLIKKILIKL